MGNGLDRRVRRQRGAALAEYGLLLAGVTLAGMVAVSVLGGKVGGLVASVATLLPGATAQDNAPVQVGRLIETKTDDPNLDGNFEQVLDAQAALHGPANRPTSRLGAALNLGTDVGETSHLYQLGDRQVTN